MIVFTKKKEQTLVLRKAAAGGERAVHKYLRREGEPGHWSYKYTEEDDDSQQAAPQTQEQSEGGRTMAPTQDEPQGQPGQSESAPAAQGSGKGATLGLSTSVLRDATPQDLGKPQMVLWTAATESGVASMRHSGRYVGSHASGGAHLAGNREAALQMAQDQPILMAIRVETQSLMPVPPAKTIEESLFPEDQMGSQALYPNSIQGNSVVGLVRQGDPLWPEGDEDSEMSRVQDETN